MVTRQRCSNRCKRQRYFYSHRRGLPHLYICRDVISGNQNEPTAMLTKMGWVLLGGNNNKQEISLNHITSDCNLENLVERFWDTECYGIVILQKK